ncbi:PIN domain-containing protein [Leisingera sp. S232]|uniref:PIN domain-containing protein n=1 Tax=Leisingera sp. S232 TaxID=3415132 RepID=UPI003C7A4DCE
MRSQFKGHFGESQETISELWKSATFVFDANVLLNLYRYSGDATQEFLRLLSDVKDRVWIPEQCAHEFLANRHTVLHEQAEAYEITLKEIEVIKAKFAKKRGHPFISEKNSGDLDRVVEAISKEFEERSKDIKGRFKEDETLNTIADIFDGRVGVAYSEEDLKKRFEEGEARFAGEVPPGYKDAKKVKEPKSSTERRRNFGDYLLWRQTIEKAKHDDASVILVTDDRKEDWWRIVHGRTVGPRPELITEFCSETGQSILIYTPESFLKFSANQLGASISQKTIGEVQAEKNARERRASKQGNVARNVKEAREAFRNWAIRSGVDAPNLKERKRLIADSYVEYLENNNFSKRSGIDANGKYLSALKRLRMENEMALRGAMQLLEEAYEYGDREDIEEAQFEVERLKDSGAQLSGEVREAFKKLRDLKALDDS